MTESIIPVADLQRFGEDCLVAVGCGREHAAAHIAVLVEADKRGHYSHGFNRLRGHYVADIRSKVRTTLALYTFWIHLTYKYIPYGQSSAAKLPVIQSFRSSSHSGHFGHRATCHFIIFSTMRLTD